MPESARAREFRCVRCGNCCRVPGYVRLGEGEPLRIAVALGLAEREFTERFTRLTADRRNLSLKERTNGECIFLEEGMCSIQDVKPRQCREFPVGWRFAGYREICRGVKE